MTLENSVLTKESLLAGSLAMALCYIARLQRIKPPGTQVFYMQINILFH